MTDKVHQASQPKTPPQPVSFLVKSTSAATCESLASGSPSSSWPSSSLPLQPSTYSTNPTILYSPSPLSKSPPSTPPSLPPPTSPRSSTSPSPPKIPTKRSHFSTAGPMSIRAQYNSVKLSNGSFAKFTNSPDSMFIIHATMGTNSQVLETESANTLRSDLKKRNGLPMSIVVDTMVGIKIETSKTKKIGIRVKCVGIRGVVPKVNSTAANVSKAKCMVGLRINIFEWTFYT